jgi:NitT/TauT family transport system substrate-binding protein
MERHTPSHYQIALVAFILTLLVVGLSLVFLNTMDHQSMIRVAYHPDLHGAGIVVLAEEKGYFKSEGLKVELIKFLSGPPEVQALISGDIDIGYVGAGAQIYTTQGRCKVLTIDSFNLGDAIIARKGRGINTISDLQGKRIGVSKGTTGEMILNLALEQAGLKPDQVKIECMDVAGAVAAFVADKIDAISIWAPYTTEIKKRVGRSGIVTLADNSSFVPQYVFLQSWVASDRFLKRHPDLAVKFMRAWFKANDYRLRHMKETVKLTSRFTQIPEDSLREMVSQTQWFDSNTIKKIFLYGMAKQWYANQEKIFVQIGKQQQVVEPERFFATSILMKAGGQEPVGVTPYPDGKTIH